VLQTLRRLPRLDAVSFGVFDPGEGADVVSVLEIFDGFDVVRLELGEESLEVVDAEV